MSRSIDYNKLYKRYLHEYKAAEVYLRIKNQEMYMSPLTKAEFKFSAKSMRHNDKMMPSQIINTIVGEQKHKYSFKQGQSWKRTAEKYGFDWRKYRVRDLRAGAVDLSQVNEDLKAAGITSGKERAKIIGEQFFGVDPVTGKSP